jgi:hypothetical protein
MRAGMERGSNKHGPHVDDELAREARSYTQGSSPAPGRTEEWREQEPPGEDQPAPRLVPGGPRKGGAPGALTGADLEARSQLGRAVPRSVLPAGRDELVRGARELDGPDHLVAELGRLPADRIFHTVYEIWEELGYRNE